MSILLTRLRKATKKLSNVLAKSCQIRGPQENSVKIIMLLSLVILTPCQRNSDLRSALIPAYAVD